MHGRVKVKTTAEQQEAKRKERQKKLTLFRGALKLAFQKIHEQSFDPEGLDITKQILAASSDYATIWNYRKDAIKFFKKNRSQSDVDEFAKHELAFIESCLRNNPKSYGCWHHRCFVMLQMNSPDWDNELNLCNLFLKFDDRNFHCWDYRRFVVEKSNHPAEKEIAFTNVLIENNFSNYSSWHYRSKLLPMVYPDVVDKRRIAEEKLLEELELVQNAFFTDPNDQSAWFYHRWLLGREEIEQKMLSLKVTKSPLSVVCTFRKPSKLSGANEPVVTVNDKVVEGKWRAISDDTFAHSWLFRPCSKKSYTSLTVTCQTAGMKAQCNVSPMDKEDVFVAAQDVETFRESSSDAKRVLLESELASCQELNDLEPGNKWVVLTMVLLMRAIDPVKYSSDMSDHLSALCTIDMKRASYYRDLQSRYNIENSVVHLDLQKRTADFSDMKLTRFCHAEILTTLTSLDVSSNQLTRLGKQFSMLVSLKELKANKNMIEEVDGLASVDSLLTLELRSNNISSQESLVCLRSCTNLKFVSLLDNPLQYLVVNEDTKNLTFDVDLPFTD